MGDHSGRPVVYALLTCHNRREGTLECLRLLLAQELPDGWAMRIVLVDDSSTDGTGAAVEAAYPEVEVLTGDGNLFWCGGMRKAWGYAATRNPEFYLLVNDDTMLCKGALLELLNLVNDPACAMIAVGAVRDPNTGAATYGGRIGKNGRDLLAPTGRNQDCATFNANLALVPRAVYERLGMLHGAYTHGMADFDYGFMARRQGIGIRQTPGFVATASRNPVSGTWRDRSLTRLDRIRRLHHPKAHPLREMIEYHRRNSGLLWPWRCLTPYLRILLGW